ncbi:hypothetical protein AB0H49_18825 [Nocardia sp. NPDC050713]
MRTARAPAAVLIRPDGYTAWATDDLAADGLTKVLRNWTDPVAALAH